MKNNFSQFHPNQYSLAEDPMFFLEDFWSQEERKVVQEAIAQWKWISLADIPPVAQAFPNCGNWQKSDIGHSDATHFTQRVEMPCIAAYVESFQA